MININSSPMEEAHDNSAPSMHGQSLWALSPVGIYEYAPTRISLLCDNNEGFAGHLYQLPKGRQSVGVKAFRKRHFRNVGKLQ